jgi:3-ketosteroid 9alpha-monooxygenase subunit A
VEVPFTMRPTGWFQVAWSGEVPTAGVLALKYFGQHLVAFRTESGQLKVLDAHCLHLGAHLGKGGTVHGEAIACPYHGWQWDGTGTNTAIPYMTRSQPSAKRLKAWDVRESSGRLLIWHDPAGGPPRWEPPDPFRDLQTRQHHTPEDYYPAWPQAIQAYAGLPIHPQQTLENVVDSIHFRYTHHAPADPVLLDYEELGEHGDRWRSVIGFRSARTGEVAMTTEALLSGVGMAVNTFERRSETYRLSFCTTPVDDETCDLFLAFWLARDPGDTGDTIPEHRLPQLEVLKSSLPEDIEIWVNQKYIQRPMYAEQDARPYSALRRWCTRFYEVPPGPAPRDVAANPALADR